MYDVGNQNFQILRTYEYNYSLDIQIHFGFAYVTNNSLDTVAKDMEAVWNCYSFWGSNPINMSYIFEWVVYGCEWDALGESLQMLSTTMLGICHI